MKLNLQNEKDRFKNEFEYFDKYLKFNETLIADEITRLKALLAEDSGPVF